MPEFPDYFGTEEAMDLKVGEYRGKAKEEGGLCPEHEAAWTLRPGGVSKAGKEYDAFWTCKERTDGEFCQEKPSKAWQARHEG